MDDYDIYGDLDQIDFAKKYEQLEELNETHVKNIESLTNEINVLNKKLKEFQLNQEKITRNISELFKTAKAEIARKDRMITELRKQIDDMLFKRNTYGGQNKRPAQEEIGEQKPIENKRPRFEKNQDKHEKSLEKQDTSHRRDHHDRERSAHHSTSSSRRNSGDESRKYEYKDNSRGSKHSKQTERRPQDKRYIDNRLTNDKKFKPSGRDSKTRDIRDGKENKSDVNTKNFENKIHNSDARVSKVDLEAYVKIERTHVTQSEKKELEEGEIEEGEIKEKEDIKLKIVKTEESKTNKNNVKGEIVPKEEKIVNEKIKIEKEKIGNEKTVVIKTKKMLNDGEKIVTSNDTISKTLNTSAQELQNAINSTKNESTEEIINEETLDKETLQAVVDPNDSSIITQGNCIKLTNNCNKSFRSRRKRVVITVTD